MECKRVWGRLWIFLIFLGLVGPSWAIPATLSVSGRLLDAKGEPIHYYQIIGTSRIEIEVNLAAELKFYDSETSQAPIHTLSATAVANYGYFSIQFTLPGSVLTRDQMFYMMAIDADRNGLTGADLFAGRFQFGSVPFALSAKPAHAFTTHGGYIRNGNPYSYLKVMNAVPFETPPGGIEFNRMSTAVVEGNPGQSFSFGIFDEQGNRVAYSGIITIKDVTIMDAFLEVKLAQTVKLEPSKIYYTGLAKTENINMANGIRPAAASFGFAPIPSSDFSLPTSFDPGQIDPDISAIPIPITLTLVTASPALARQNMDPDKPEIRWIIPKSPRKTAAQALKK